MGWIDNKKITILAIVVMLLCGFQNVFGEFMAHWYVLHNTNDKTVSNYFSGIDEATLEGILPQHLKIEDIYACDIIGNTSGIAEDEVERLVREQFRKETYQLYSLYDPPNNPYIKMAPLDTLIGYCSRFYKVNNNYIKAIILKESGVNAQMTGPQGEIGLMQLSINRIQNIINEKGLKNFDVQNLYEPAWNIGFGCYYLWNLSQDYDKDVDKMLSAYYNDKTTPVGRAGIPARETEDEYVARVKYLALIFDSFPQPGDKTRLVIK